MAPAARRGGAGREATGEKIGRLTGEQAEIARLRRRLDKAERRLATTEVALVIVGKAHELLDGLTKSSVERVFDEGWTMAPAKERCLRWHRALGLLRRFVHVQVVPVLRHRHSEPRFRAGTVQPRSFPRTVW